MRTALFWLLPLQTPQRSPAGWMSQLCLKSEELLCYWSPHQCAAQLDLRPSWQIIIIPGDSSWAASSLNSVGWCWKLWRNLETWSSQSLQRNDSSIHSHVRLVGSSSHLRTKVGQNQAHVTSRQLVTEAKLSVFVSHRQHPAWAVGCQTAGQHREDHLFTVMTCDKMLCHQHARYLCPPSRSEEGIENTLHLSSHLSIHLSVCECCEHIGRCNLATFIIWGSYAF